jgi:hypothetical protein
MKVIKCSICGKDTSTPGRHMQRHHPTVPYVGTRGPIPSMTAVKRQSYERSRKQVIRKQQNAFQLDNLIGIGSATRSTRQPLTQHADTNTTERSDHGRGVTHSEMQNVSSPIKYSIYILLMVCKPFRAGNHVVRFAILASIASGAMWKPNTLKLIWTLNLDRLVN